MSQPVSQQRWPAYVLAGGRSLRLGQDKARALVDEKTTVLEAALSPFEDTFLSWTAVADRPNKYDDLGVRTIADERADVGPLGGILRACGDCDAAYFFVISCDRLGLCSSWVAPLAQIVARQQPMAVTVGDGRRRQPLFGFYRRRCAPKITDFMAQGGRAVWRFLAAVDAAQVALPPGWEQTISVNRPGDLEQARQMWSIKQKND